MHHSLNSVCDAVTTDVNRCFYAATGTARNEPIHLSET